MDFLIENAKTCMWYGLKTYGAARSSLFQQHVFNPAYLIYVWGMAARAFDTNHLVRPFKASFRWAG
jgi:hypothetical protein